MYSNGADSKVNEKKKKKNEKKKECKECGEDKKIQDGLGRVFSKYLKGL